MALANTSRAIGAVTQTLRERVTSMVGTAADLVTVGRPEPASGAGVNHSRLNLFLYEIHVDEFLRNESLDEGQPSPLWLVLHYLLTAFDTSGESDSEAAHAILGAGLRALHAINFLQPTAGSSAPLQDNPNRLKVTFDGATVELLSKLMQGPDMKYRCSAAFQVRPVLIAPAPPPSYAQLVGINYTAGGTVIGEEGVRVDVQPSLGPLLETVSPAKFEPGVTLRLEGTDLNVENLTVQMAGLNLPIVSRDYEFVECTVPLSINAGNLLSAGSLPVTAVQSVFAHPFSSNAVIGGLLPHVDTITPSAITPVNANPGAPVTAVLDLAGTLLSTASDAVFVGLSKDGAVVRLFDQFTRPTTDQKTLRLAIPTELAVNKGTYRVILRVNGQQALNSPAVTL